MTRTIKTLRGFKFASPATIYKELVENQNFIFWTITSKKSNYRDYYDYEIIHNDNCPYERYLEGVENYPYGTSQAINELSLLLVNFNIEFDDSSMILLDEDGGGRNISIIRFLQYHDHDGEVYAVDYQIKIIDNDGFTKPDQNYIYRFRRENGNDTLILI